MKRNRKKIVISIFCILVFSWWFFRDLISYGIMQAKGQYHIISNAQPINGFLNDQEFPDSLKNKIKLIQQVRQFAIDSLGLKNSDNYTTLFDQKGKDILWNLSASEKYKLAPYEWSFPFLGTFSYKGFFNLEKAETEKEILDQEGYDTRIRPVGGWSTLGWFKDPILSNMLSRENGELAELIIHELTHATLYIKDSVDFNENLATFIGEKGAIKFLRAQYGSNSIEEEEYLNSFVISKKFADHMLRGYKSLSNLYDSEQFITEEDTVTKSRLKSELIQSIVKNLDTISFKGGKKYKNAFSKRLPNNAYFMAFLRYRAKQDLFESDFTKLHNNDIRQFINYYTERFPSL